jgi:putative phage-type endonuclease
LDTITDEQRTAEWFQARVGKATASRFKDVMAKLKNGSPAAARINYLVDIATERLTKSATPHYSNSAMQWGVTHEASARIVYEQRRQLQVEETGFIQHEELDAGASPDGLVDWDGLIEIKCPYNSSVHVMTWMDGMPEDHVAQVQGQLWITGRQWCDFISFDPRMPPALQLYVERIGRNDSYIAGLETEIRKFLIDVDTMVATLMEKSK